MLVYAWAIEQEQDSRRSVVGEVKLLQIVLRNVDDLAFYVAGHFPDTDALLFSRSQIAQQRGS